VDVEAIRDTLRSSRAPELRRRRTIAALCSAGLVDFAVISLYQVGILRHLPDLPGRLFDSDSVNASTKAYRLGVPDGPLGALQYAATLALAAAGGTWRTGRRPLFACLLGLSAAGGALAALDYLRDMLFVQKRVCPYCLVGAGINLALVPLALAEVRDARARR
jgi:uncharacterized membrane protein